MNARSFSSIAKVIQSSCPSGPATKPSTDICTCSLSFFIVLSEDLVSYTSNENRPNRQLVERSPVLIPGEGRDNEPRTRVNTPRHLPLSVFHSFASRSTLRGEERDACFEWIAKMFTPQTAIVPSRHAERRGRPHSPRPTSGSAPKGAHARDRV